MSINNTIKKYHSSRHLVWNFLPYECLFVVVSGHAKLIQQSTSNVAPVNTIHN